MKHLPPGRACDLLPVPYHHVVFTLPRALGPMALQNQRIVHGILFRALSDTLQTIALDPKHLGARIGFPALLQRRRHRRVRADKRLQWTARFWGRAIAVRTWGDWQA